MTDSHMHGTQARGCSQVFHGAPQYCSNTRPPSLHHTTTALPARSAYKPCSARCPWSDISSTGHRSCSRRTPTLQKPLLTLLPRAAPRRAGTRFVCFVRLARLHAHVCVLYVGVHVVCAYMFCASACVLACSVRVHVYVHVHVLTCFVCVRILYACVCVHAPSRFVPVRPLCVLWHGGSCAHGGSCGACVFCGRARALVGVIAIVHRPWLQCVRLKRAPVLNESPCPRCTCR